MAPRLTLPADFREFIELLNAHRIEYVLVGGHAVALHGHPRSTGDMDILVRATEENAKGVLRVLSDFGFGDIDLGVDDLTRPRMTVQLGYPPLRIDITTSLTGVSNEAVFASAEWMELENLKIRVISRDCLIENKRATGRDKDRLDVTELEGKG